MGIFIEYSAIEKLFIDFITDCDIQKRNVWFIHFTNKVVCMLVVSKRTKEKITCVEECFLKNVLQ